MMTVQLLLFGSSSLVLSARLLSAYHTGQTYTMSRSTSRTPTTSPLFRPSPKRRNLPSDDFLFVGAITQPHGIHGELRVHTFNPDSDALFEIEEIWLRPPNTSYIQPCDLLEARETSKCILLLLEGCDSRNQAELLRKTELYVAKADLPALEEDEFYFYQLEGLPVFSTEGEVLGDVVRVLPSAAQDLLILAYQGREVMIPITEALVPVIDLDEGRIEIEVLPGLLGEEEG